MGNKEKKGEKVAKLRDYSYLRTKLSKLATLSKNGRGGRNICDYLFFLLCYD